MIVHAVIGYCSQCGKEVTSKDLMSDVQHSDSAVPVKPLVEAFNQVLNEGLPQSASSRLKLISALEGVAFYISFNAKDSKTKNAFYAISRQLGDIWKERFVVSKEEESYERLVIKDPTDGAGCSQATV